MRPQKATRNNQCLAPFQTLDRQRAGIYAVLIAALCGCTEAARAPTGDARHSELPSHTVHSWITSADNNQRLTPLELVLNNATSEPATLEIDTTRRYQTVVGFGAAVTDASASLIRSKMSAVQRRTLMRELFGPPPGLRIGFIRLTIGASDFSATHYSLDDRPDGTTDPELKHFSIAPIRNTVVPVVREALALNPSLRVMASPWSAPGWMKTNGALVQGTLLPQFYSAFAGYLVKYVAAMEAQGIPLFALTLQNEPHFEPSDYPGMRLDAQARSSLIGQYLGPALAQRQPTTRILEWDHNWIWPQEPLGVLDDPRAAQYVSGVAWHCYQGNVSAQTQVHLAHPDKDAYLTECSGGTWGAPSDPSLLNMTRNLVIGSTRAWARGVLLWNLALDESGGPHHGGCTDCRGLITIDSRTGQVTRNPDYYVIAHASRFVHPGAQRIESTQTDAGLDNVAFQNLDDGSMVLISANSSTSPRAVLVRCGEGEFRINMPAQSIATSVWMPPE